MADKTANRPIILLDLNFTLVANSKERFKYVKQGKYRQWVREHERFRGWLVDLVRDRHVILITARDECYIDDTLASIERETGWRPEEWLFNPDPRAMEPHVWKEKAINECVFPKHGPVEPGKYLAIESNSLTQAMYSRYAIYACPIPKDGSAWTSLPRIPTTIPILPAVATWFNRKPKPKPEQVQKPAQAQRSFLD